LRCEERVVLAEVTGGYRNGIKKIIATIIFAVLFICVLVTTSKIFERKYSYSKYYDFYNQDEDFDVLFFGTSHVINAVYPMELWRDYGLVSYNMSNHSENICTNYWQLINALNYTTPKVVVVDLYAVDGDSKVNERYLHNVMDSMSLSITKIRMTMDLLEKDKWAEYLFDFSLYHSRWEELESSDFKPETDVTKGAEIYTEVTINTPPELIPKQQYDATDRTNKRYLQKIIDLCKEKDIDVILTYIPYSMPTGDMEVANWGYVCAENNDIPYLNFVYEDLDINYATDCMDESHHLNVSGARKVTDYIGKYLTENYNLEDKRTVGEYSYWNADYEEYKQMKFNLLKNEPEEWSYLALLNDKDYKVRIYANEHSNIYYDDELIELIDNINVFGSVTIEEEPQEYSEYNYVVEVYDSITGELLDTRMMDW
jgi:hypothetical protein